MSDESVAQVIAAVNSRSQIERLLQFLLTVVLGIVVGLIGYFGMDLKETSERAVEKLAALDTTVAVLAQRLETEAKLLRREEQALIAADKQIIVRLQQIEQRMRILEAPPRSGGPTR